MERSTAVCLQKSAADNLVYLNICQAGQNALSAAYSSEIRSTDSPQMTSLSTLGSPDRIESAAAVHDYGRPTLRQQTIVCPILSRTLDLAPLPPTMLV